MKKSTIKKVLLTLMVMLSIMLTTVPTFAVDEVETGTVNKIEEVVENNTTDETDKSNTQTPGTITPGKIDTTIGDDEVTTIPAFFEKIQQKMMEIVAGSKSVLQPAIVLFFIISAVLAIAGAISKKGSVMTGIIGCIVCVLAYHAIANAEFIIQSISHWLGS